MNNKKSIGLLDGDVMIYRACNKSLKDGIDVTEVWDNLYDALTTEIGCTDYSLHLSQGGNFRKDLKQGFTNYKGKRKDKPENYHYLRDYVYKTYDVISAAGYEADDTISIEATKYLKEGQFFVVATVDKDLKNIGGLFYNIMQGSLTAISKEMAIDFFHRQLLTGDDIDNIPGIKGVGKVKCNKILGDSSMYMQFYKIIKAYQEHYPDDWEERLNVMGKLLYLVKDYDDPFWNIDFWWEYLRES